MAPPPDLTDSMQTDDLTARMAGIGARVEAARARLIAMHRAAGLGHLGGNLSCIDILTVLFHAVLREDDRFILSKGHSAGALYVALWSIGTLDDDALATFGRDDSLLTGHPCGQGVPGVLFPTGSLGHGPSLAAGLALAAKHRGSDRRIHCLCSDGEWQEGSCWEALAFAVHHRLDNLTLIVDQNGLQGFGRVDEVVGGPPLRERVAAFGARLVVGDGHDATSIAAALGAHLDGRPTVVVMNTVKGRGTAWEDQLESHYLPPGSDDSSGGPQREDRHA